MAIRGRTGYILCRSVPCVTDCRPSASCICCLIVRGSSWSLHQNTIIIFPPASEPGLHAPQDLTGYRSSGQFPALLSFSLRRAVHAALGPASCRNAVRRMQIYCSAQSVNPELISDICQPFSANRGAAQIPGYLCLRIVSGNTAAKGSAASFAGI